MSRRRYLMLVCLALFTLVLTGCLLADTRKVMSYLAPTWKKDDHSAPGMNSADEIGRSIATLSEYTSTLPTGPDEPRLPNGVIIMASMRTGSSFVGELLANSKDVFYLFEPGLSLQLAVEKIESSLGIAYDQTKLYINMLRQLFQCDFRNLDFYLNSLSKEYLPTLQKRGPRLYDACIRQYNGDYCLVTRRMATESCKRSKYIVIKVIRIPVISFLLPMVEGMNLKVIHLVRDPRPVTASRVLAMTGQKLVSPNQNDSLFSSEIQTYFSNYCRWNVESAETARLTPSLQKRYMFLRYEDVASDPTSAAGRIHKFLGRNQVPGSVHEWIHANTKFNRPELFSTTRNSSQVCNAWRHTMSFSTAKAIEGFQECREMMRKMGYGLLENEMHQRDLSRSLVYNVTPVAVPATN